MININESQITDILPDNLKATPDVQSLSYAIQKANQKMLDYAKKSRTYAAIQELPETILDVLSIELRSQYYDANLPLEMKRNIVANTLLWYSIAGTPYAVEEFVTTIFGTGRVIEWFDYEGGSGTPGTFMIETSAVLEPDTLEKLTVMITKIKNTRSHLSKINILSVIQGIQYHGGALLTVPKYKIIDGGL